MAKRRKRRGRRPSGVRPSVCPSVSARTHSGLRYISRPCVEIDRGLAWYAIFTAARAERRVEAALRASGLATYAPVESVEVLRRNRLVEVERSAVSRYLFVGLNAADPQWHSVHAAFDLPGFLGQQSLGRILKADGEPLRVPAGQLARLADGLSLQGDTLRMAVGSPIVVRKGPWEAFCGTVEASGDYRVRALLDIFGRQTPVEFNADQLEAAA